MRKILLVEDNDLNRDMLSRRLVRRGFAVVTAENGAEGIVRARQERPDLILMDMNMPVLDGWEASRQIRRDPEIGHLPIIALTAHALVTDRQQALEAGCDDFATKPVELENLTTRIAALLRRKDSE